MPETVATFGADLLTSLQQPGFEVGSVGNSPVAALLAATLILALLTVSSPFLAQALAHDPDRSPSRRIATPIFAMEDAQPNEKVVYALQSAVATNMKRLRDSIDGLRQIHNRLKDNNGTSINLIAQLTALKSNLANMHDWLSHALSDMHPQLLSDLDVLMTSCGMLMRHLDALVKNLKQPDHVPLDYATRVKYAVGSRSMERLRKVAQGQTEAVTLLLAACKW